MTENMGITTLTEEDRSATGALAPVSYTHLKKPAASRPRAFFRSRRYRKAADSRPPLSYSVFFMGR